MVSPGEPAGAGRQGSGSATPASPASGSHPVPGVLLTIAVVLVVLTIVIVLIVLKLSGVAPVRAAPFVQPAPSAVASDIASVPAKAFDAVGDPAGPVLDQPSKVDGKPTLELRGLPAVVWVGGLYCPTCSAERWALVVALSRFGTFKKLYVTQSSSHDVYPSIPSFSFYPSEYESSDVSLSAVEEYGNTQSAYAPSGYEKLQSPTPFEAAVLHELDRKPWVTQSGILPFVDVANKIVISGSSFDPSVLSGLTIQQIATRVLIPTSHVGQAVLGAANQITAAICDADANRPRSVCHSSAVTETAALVGLSS